MVITLNRIFIISFLLILFFTMPVYAKSKEFIAYTKKVISIDLDGVLDNYCGKYDENNIPEIKDGARDFIIKLYKKYDLILFSTRNPDEVEKWLIKNELREYFKLITDKKYPSYIYLDDRALKFNGNYNKTFDEIENFNVYWKK